MGAERPNILAIMVDDLGYGDLSSYGGQDIQTPNIDALMGKGMRFNRFYANCPVCSPTRASFVSGRYPDLVGVPGVIRTHAENNWGYMKPDFPTIADMLKRAGYHTALVGKWHLGLEPPNTPNLRGFDHFHGFLCDMIDDYWIKRRHGINYMRLNDQEISPEGHATDLFTKWAMDYLKSRKAQPDSPWFLYLAYNAPHTPIQPPPDWLERVKRREPGITEQRAKLVALIEHLDDGIGQVMAALNETGFADNTLIVFTSDNGGQLSVGANNGPLRGGKQDMYEGGIRVATCCVWPGKITPGQTTDFIAMTMDWYPTFCEAAGVPIKHTIDGQSVLPLLLGRELPPFERDLFWVRREGGARYQAQDYYAIRRGDWKLLHNTPFEPLQLFDLAADPLETRDLAEKNRQVFQAMSAALRVHIQQAGSVPWQKEAGGTDHQP